MFNLPQVFRSLRGLGFDASKPSIWLIEDVVEYMVRSRRSALSTQRAQHGRLPLCFTAWRALLPSFPHL